MQSAAQFVDLFAGGFTVSLIAIDLFSVRNSLQKDAESHSFGPPSGKKYSMATIAHRSLDI